MCWVDGVGWCVGVGYLCVEVESCCAHVEEGLVGGGVAGGELLPCGGVFVCAVADDVDVVCGGWVVVLEGGDGGVDLVDYVGWVVDVHGDECGWVVVWVVGFVVERVVELFAACVVDGEGEVLGVWLGGLEGGVVEILFELWVVLVGVAHEGGVDA